MTAFYVASYKTWQIVVQSRQCQAQAGTHLLRGKPQLLQQASMTNATTADWQVQQEELTRMAAEHAQKTAEQRLAEALSDAQQSERDDNAVQRRLTDQAGTIMGLQHSLQSAQADLHKFHAAHAR